MWQPKFMLFIGSGFSQSQDGPSWEKLRNLAVSELTGHLAKAEREHAWERLAELVLASTKSARAYDSPEMRKKPEFATWVIGEAFGGATQLAWFLKRHLLSRPTLLHAITVEKVLKDQGIILTTEFDGLFEETMRQLCPKDGYEPEQVDTPQDESDKPLAQSPRPVRVHKCAGKEVLVELHGSVHDASTLICFPDQVASWRNRKASQRIADLLKKTDRAIFWGCGGNDHDIVELFKHVGLSRGAFSRTLVVDLVKAKPHLLGELREIPLFNPFELVPCDGLSAEETWQLIEDFIR